MKHIIFFLLFGLFVSMTVTACNPFGSQDDTATSKVQKKFGE